MTHPGRRDSQAGASHLHALMLLAGCLLVGGCREAPPPLTRTFASPEALASAVTDALSRTDGAVLAGLALSEEEFRHYVWPSLPVSRPERNLPFDYVWKDLQAKSRAHLAARLNDPALRGLTVTEVAFDGEATEYSGFTVMRKARLHVRDGEGVARSVRLFGSMLRKDGRYKLFSYVVD